LIDMKLIYKPFGIVVGLLAGMLGRSLFSQVWGHIDDQEAPGPTTRDVPWAKLLVVAAIQGMIFQSVKVFVNRAGAKGFEHLTGYWPGEKVPDPK
jgi:hypothetical protein